MLVQVALWSRWPWRPGGRLSLARQHAKVADARREFCHQLSTRLIRDNQRAGMELRLRHGP
jgi:hypothetical protein